MINRIYIHGNDYRNKDIIKVLESLGGINRDNFDGDNSDRYYYIDPADYTIRFFLYNPSKIGNSKFGKGLFKKWTQIYPPPVYYILPGNYMIEDAADKFESFLNIRIGGNTIRHNKEKMKNLVCYVNPSRDNNMRIVKEDMYGYDYIIKEGVGLEI